TSVSSPPRATDPVEQGGSRTSGVVLLVLCSILALHNAMRIGPVTLIEELRGRYGVDYAGVGNVVGAYTLAYGFSQLVAGLLTDRVGSRRLMLVGLGLGAVGSATFAVTEAYPVAVLARLLMGVAGGCLYTPTVAYAFAAFPDALRGRAMGFAEAGVGAGQILSLLGLPVLFAAAGLTPAFLSLPVAALALGLAAALGLPDVPPSPRAARGSIRGLCGERDFWLLVVGFAFVGMLAQVAVLSWMPTYLRQVHGYGVVSAGVSTGIVVTGLMLFSPLFGILSDRLTARRPVMLAGCLLAVAGFLVLLVTREPWVAVGAALLVSASMAATIPMQVVFASERFRAVGAGTAIGLVNTGGQIAASLGGPLYGTFLDRGLGFGAVWGVALALGLLRLLALLGIREPRR
ncbi:MAG TPA: MFS transporter, partial [Vicinamibacteria bacterium]|nr:MFS transporter [Vicinamibacteria bacterium]